MMPLYTYLCPECRKVFDIEKAMSDPHPTTHVCGFEGELGRVFSPPAITFRGSGFYSTDKGLDKIDPEYDLTDAQAAEYFAEKERHGDDRKIKVFT
jgi:putative FmdB family regulatory protein